MYCQTCAFECESFCAVNPTHIQGGWSKACRYYEHDASKEIVCGNCSAFSMSECALNKHSVDASDKGCMDFFSQRDIDFWREQMVIEDRYEMLSNIKVKLVFNNGKFEKLVLLK